MWQGYLNRQSAHFSVRPFLQVSTTASPVPGFPRAGLYLTNVGAGVALLSELNFYLGAEKIADPEGPMHWLVEVFKKQYPDSPHLSYVRRVPNVVSPDSPPLLLGIAPEDWTPESGKRLFDFLSQLEVRGKYRSLYNEPFTLLRTPLE